MTQSSTRPRRVRVLFIADYFLPTVGGVQSRALPMMIELARRGHAFLVVAGDGHAATEFEGISIRRFPLIDALQDGDVERWHRIRREIFALTDEFDPDVVHAFISGPAVLAHLDNPARKAPLIVSLTIWPTHETAAPDTILGRALREARCVTANSNALLRRVYELVPETAGRSTLLVSGNPLPGAAPDPLPFEPPVLLCLGRLVADKGFDLAIRALAKLREARLVIAGDGPARPALDRLAGDLGIADRVEFTGWVGPDAVAGLINRSTVVLVPSRWEEAFASVAIEAAQMGRPVVATAVGGMSEAVIDGETGILVPREDDAALAEAVAMLLRDRERAVRLGARSRERAFREFSFDRYVGDVADLYSSLLPAASIAPGRSG